LSCVHAAPADIEVRIETPTKFEGIEQNQGILKQGITNGGFETGDFTGYVNGGSTITSTNPHSGKYCAVINVSNFAQTLVNAVPVNNMVLFGFWYNGDGKFGGYVYFSNGSSQGFGTDLSGAFPTLGYWAFVNLSNIIIPRGFGGLNITKVYFEWGGDAINTYIDDISLTYVIW
jgi:hypothetical protein